MTKHAILYVCTHKGTSIYRSRTYLSIYLGCRTNVIFRIETHRYTHFSFLEIPIFAGFYRTAEKIFVLILMFQGSVDGEKFSGSSDIFLDHQIFSNLTASGVTVMEDLRTDQEQDP